MKFKDKVAIITGAGRGIGRAIAMSYAAEGASVVIAEKDQVTGAEAEKTITSAGGTACFIKTDISRPEEIAAMIKKAAGLYGTIDILVNNAGLGMWKPPCDLTVGEWDEVINTNLRGSFLCAREAALVMRQKGGGSIINIASTRALMSEPDSEAYAASKGGLVALTHALAASLASDHIRVNCISPGWIETGDYDKLREADHRQHFSGRVGRPEDIASACLFLSSEDSAFITGANIIIDGGMTRKMIYEP
ncbi:MAG: glucose 1-dehydrogenase [Bacteroidales bacterium]|jgi:NAD(P)-dependent dehydrogenase (short-subunit alcohol dehydrogenase family)|nr:glucose 1-dehydrogenase [Bacteroidales bacterium]